MSDADPHDVRRDPRRPGRATPRPAATTNPIHQDPEVARSVGLPDVIAHGMFTLALAARYVDELLGEPGRIAELGAKFTKPVVVPEDGTEVDRRGRVARRAHPAPSPSPAATRPCWATRSRSCVPELAARDHTTLRLGGPARSWVRATTDDELRRRRTPGRRGGRARARAGRRQQPRGRRRGLRRHRGRGRDARGDRRLRQRRPDLRRRGRGGGGRRELGRRRGDRGRAGLGRRRGPLRHPGLGRGHPDPERRRLRPGGLPDRRPVRVWDRTTPRRPHVRRRRLRLRLPHQPRSRPTPPDTSCSRSPSSSARASSGPRSRTPSWRALGRRAGRPGPDDRRARAVLDLRRRARGWCSTRPTTTPGAPGRSSPTRCVRRRPRARRAPRPGPSPTARSRPAPPG